MIRKKLTARQYSNPLITGFRSRSLGPGDLKINEIDIFLRFAINRGKDEFLDYVDGKDF